MKQKHFIIIGNGPAGNQAALTLRTKSPEARITLLSKHPGGCYRPHLLPHYISGKIDADSLYVFSPSSYKDKNIKLRSGQEVLAIDLNKNQITLDHKEILPFDGLIIATGGKPCIPEHLTEYRELMLTLKTIDDAKVWKQDLAKTRTVLIIGGDLTSFAFTKTLLDMGKKVYFAFNQDAFWPLKFDENLAEDATNKLQQKGVTVLKDFSFEKIKKLSGGPMEVDTGKDNFRVGLIGAFFGLAPDIRFACNSGFKIDKGILVDEHLYTGFEGVYATGDCAQVYHPEIRDYWISIGHDNAVKLGHIAALNLAGEMVQAEIAKENIFEIQGVKANTSWWTEF